MSVSRLLVFGCTLLLVMVASLTLLARGAVRQRLAELDAERSVTMTRHGRLEYTMWGSGPPVLVIHGAGGGFDQGRLLAEAMGGTGFTFIAVSRFGYLGSELPAEPSTQAQAEAFVDLLDTLGLDRVAVLAMSGGVPPALKFAELFPKRSGRMVLLSSAPFTPFGPDIEARPVPTWVYSVLLGNDVVYWVLTRVARRQLNRAFDARDDLVGDLSPREALFLRRLVDGFLPASRRLAGVNNEGAAVDPAARYGLEAIQSPVLVVHAQDDRLNPVAVGQEIARRIPTARLLSLEQGGHLLLGHHDRLQQEVGEFLREAGR